MTLQSELQGKVVSWTPKLLDLGALVEQTAGLLQHLNRIASMLVPQLRWEHVRP